MSGTIIIAGLGPGDPAALPAAVLDELAAGGVNWLRTGVHPVVPWLRQRGISFNTFDAIYQAVNDFDKVYRQIAQHILEAGRLGRVLYAVPGHPHGGRGVGAADNGGGGGRGIAGAGPAGHELS